MRSIVIGSYCCSWAFARYHGTRHIGAGECRSRRSSRSRNGFGDPGALLSAPGAAGAAIAGVGAAGDGGSDVRVLSAAPINDRIPRRANAARRVFVGADEIGVFSAQRACGAAKLIGGRATLNW